MPHKKNRLLRNYQGWRKEKQYRQSENDDAFSHVFSSHSQSNEAYL
jgi:hypothetical protein